MHELGGYATFFSDEEIGLDSRESAEDVGRTLAEMYAIAALRVRDHGVFARMRAGHPTSDMSLINLLSNQGAPHPGGGRRPDHCRALRRRRRARLAGLEVAYVGDATNVTRSLAVALLRSGRQRHHRRARRLPAAPRRRRGPVVVTAGGSAATHATHPHDAVKGADVVYTDAWVSMGAESETAQRRDGPERRSESTRRLWASAKDAAVLCTACPRTAATRSPTTSSTRDARWCGARCSIAARP